MSRKSPIVSLLVMLVSLVLAATASAQSGPNTHPGGPGGFDTPPAQAFEEFTIRLEPALGSPRCPESQSEASHCEPLGWLSTRSQDFVNITGEAFLRGDSEVPQGVQMTSSFVASQDDTNVAFQFSAEAKVEDDTPGLDRRMFVRALIDGVPAAPSDVVFARPGHEGTQSFIFTANVDAGIHTVEIQWKVDADATASIRDASLFVRMGRDVASEKGTFTTVTAPSGMNQVTAKQSWQDVPGMSASVYVPKGGQVTASFSAEAFTSNGKRLILRAVLDGAAMNPGDVVFVNHERATSQAMTFGMHNVGSGWHTVKVQWQVEAGGTASVGDRTLAVSALPVRTDGGSHYFVAAPSGANVYTEKGVSTPLPLPDMSIDFTIPANGNGEVAVQFSAEIDAVDGAVAMVGLAIDGELQLDGFVQAADGSQPAQVKSFVFEAKGVAPGKHTAEILFASATGDGQAYAGDRTMNLLSATGFIPDLAEAPKFSGGHIGLEGDYIAGIEPLIGTRKVLAVLIDPGFCSGTIDPQTGDLCYNQYTVQKGEVDSAIFGTSVQPGWGAFQPNNIATQLTTMSGGRFTIVRAGAGISGWYDTDKSVDAYYKHDGTCTDGYDDGGAMLMAEAVTKAGAAINFATFDTDGNGELSHQELAILVVIPRKDGDGSSIQYLYGSTCGANTRLELDGVVMPQKVAKWNTSLDEGAETFQFTTGTHELLHLIGGTDDLYLKEDVSTYPRDMSLMASNRSTTTHLDPFHKLAFGWATPVLVQQSGQVTVSAVAQSNTVYVLPRYNNPWEEEYYILENRKEGMGQPYFDEDINDSGIAVWHIVSDRVENQQAPIGTTQAKWDASHIPGDKPGSLGQMGRNGIRLIRPFDDVENGTAKFINKDLTFWTNADYDLESGSCLLIAGPFEPFHNKLAWADCEASGYSLEFVDPAIEDLRVNITVE
ncbi:MAG: hypothetical protein IT303_19230 [Dehalococcoidia bacterium]|nr:hypothetical protein [Dehalococcoidia bacterium]